MGVLQRTDKEIQEDLSALGVIYEQILTRYSTDFNQILSTIWGALQEHPLPVRNDGYWAALHRSIREQIIPGVVNYRTELADIRQQLHLIWWTTTTRSLKAKDLRKELRRFSLFGMRNWIRLQMHVPRQELQATVHHTESSEIMPELDLKFLVYGTTKEPFCYLSKRDRYELYLRYVNEKTIEEMEDIVRYRKQNVIDHLKINHAFLRSIYDYPQDPG